MSFKKFELDAGSRPAREWVLFMGRLLSNYLAPALSIQKLAMKMLGAHLETLPPVFNEGVGAWACDPQEFPPGSAYSNDCDRLFPVMARN
jgi:hypothetical protein